MTGIILTYFNRPFQLSRTLQTLQTEIESKIYIVDDGSTEVPSLPGSAELIRLEHNDTWRGGMIPFNIGMKRAIDDGCDVIVIQNAECYHVGDVIGEASKVADGEYLSFGCFSLDHIVTFQDHNIYKLIYEHNHIISVTGGMGWYNHPTIRPTGYHFCCAMTVNTAKALNGFDERFCEGVAFDDDDLIRRVRTMGLNVRITENPFVVHQWHYTGERVPGDLGVLVEKNRLLHNALALTGNIRAEHIYTPDL